MRWSYEFNDEINNYYFLVFQDAKLKNEYYRDEYIPNPSQCPFESCAIELMIVLIVMIVIFSYSLSLSHDLQYRSLLSSWLLMLSLIIDMSETIFIENPRLWIWYKNKPQTQGRKTFDKSDCSIFFHDYHFIIITNK